MKLPPLLLFFCLILSPDSTAWAASRQAEVYYQEAVRQSGTADLQRVFALYAKAAELGHASAQYNIAMMYANGESVFVDYQQAAYWFGLSARQNFTPAQFRLGEMYYFGNGGLERNLDKAVELLQKAAKGGDADAQMDLAMLIGSGEGIEHSKEQAEFWLLKADHGLNDAAPHYLQLLRDSADGNFSPEQQQEYWDQQRDFWIRKAATLGVREAQEALRKAEAQSEPEPNPKPGPKPDRP